MALGLLCSLPFRHSQPIDVADLDASLQSPAMLGDGIALQVPGQTAVEPYEMGKLVPLPTDVPARQAEVQEEIVFTTATSAEFSQPPPLPDEYQPLYSPDVERLPSGGRVVVKRENLAATPKRLRRHTIRDGDTLASLAQRYLGSSERSKEILAANRSVLESPDVLPIGIEIVIPAKTAAAPGNMTESGEPKLVPLPSLGFSR